MRSLSLPDNSGLSQMSGRSPHTLNSGIEGLRTLSTENPSGCVPFTGNPGSEDPYVQHQPVEVSRSYCN